MLASAITHDTTSTLGTPEVLVASRLLSSAMSARQRSKGCAQGDFLADPAWYSGFLAENEDCRYETEHSYVTGFLPSLDGYGQPKIAFLCGCENQAGLTRSPSDTV